MAQRMRRSGNSYDSAMMESLWARLKKKWCTAIESARMGRRGWRSSGGSRPSTGGRGSSPQSAMSPRGIRASRERRMTSRWVPRVLWKSRVQPEFHPRPHDFLKRPNITKQSPTRHESFSAPGPADSSICRRMLGSDKHAECQA